MNSDKNLFLPYYTDSPGRLHITHPHTSVNPRKPISQFSLPSHLRNNTHKTTKAGATALLLLFQKPALCKNNCLQDQLNKPAEISIFTYITSFLLYFSEHGLNMRFFEFL